MEKIFTREKEWLDKWDDFVLSENVSSHLLLSEWNRSFLSYGFDFEVCLLLNQSEICGGYVAVIAKAAFFKFYIVPFGPIVSQHCLAELNDLIAVVPQRAKALNCCYAHISLPFSKQENPHVYHSDMNLPILKTAREGNPFKYVYSAYGINWKSVKEFETDEDLINSFKSTFRRNTRSAQRKGLELRFLKDEASIKKGYDLCLDNAQANGYSLRDWNSFKETLVNMINQNTAHFLAAYFEEDIKSAVLIVKAGNFYTYILGGTKKEKPDLLAGHFLQFEAMRLAHQEKLSGYNISLGGSEGVMTLKSGYADEQIYFEKGKHYWVLKPFYFKMYLFFETYLKRYKKQIAKLLTLFKR